MAWHRYACNVHKEVTVPESIVKTHATNVPPAIHLTSEAHLRAAAQTAHSSRNNNWKLRITDSAATLIGQLQSLLVHSLVYLCLSLESLPGEDESNLLPITNSICFDQVYYFVSFGVHTSPSKSLGKHTCNKRCC